MDIELKILNKEFYCDDMLARLPAYATLGSSAWDLRTPRDLIILPNCSILVPTGLAIHINNPNIAGIILPRSGLGHRDGLVIGNILGLIDSDYTGELKLSLWNRSEQVRYYTKGDRVAQITFIQVERAKVKVVEEFTAPSERGEGGYGSTGRE